VEKSEKIPEKNLRKILAKKSEENFGKKIWENLRKILAKKSEKNSGRKI
jgi:hypothetical protein